jgi:SNF2 family DNA or RNA helicase
MGKWEYKFKTPPDPHQTLALKQALKAKRFGIFFQQRVGKTKVAIDFCGVKYSSDKVRRVLIVCPLSVRSEWWEQIQEHLPRQVSRLLWTYPETTVKQKQMFDHLYACDGHIMNVVIINYDKLITQTELLMKWKPEVIIFDESHLLKNHNSKRSKQAHKLAKNCENVLLLTGTPIPKHWYDVFSQFRVLNEHIFGSKWTTFRDKYAIMGGYMGKEIIGCTDYEAISDTIARHSIRVLRKDVFEEPKVEYVTIPIQLEPKAKKMYDELKKQFVLELSDAQIVTADMAVTRLMRLQQLCGGFTTTDEGDVIEVSTAKLDILKDLVQTKIDGGEQVVIFHRFTAEGQGIYNALVGKGIRCGRINGEITERYRKYYRDQFQDGQLDVMVIQIATGAMGITLDKAHINIFYSLDFSLSNFQQARDRVMGRNQHDDVTNYMLAVDKTVDKKIMDTLKKDEDIASSISDKWRVIFNE